MELKDIIDVMTSEDICIEIKSFAETIKELIEKLADAVKEVVETLEEIQSKPKYKLVLKLEKPYKQPFIKIKAKARNNI